MFSWELFTTSKKELLLWYAGWYDSLLQVHQIAWDTFDHLCKKAQKSVKKLERKYYTNNLCITDAVQLCNSSIHYILQLVFFGNWSWKFGIRVWKKPWFDTRCKVNKAYKFVFYMSKQSINFKKEETSWFRGLFLHFHNKKIISFHEHMAFVTVNRFCLL